MGRYILFRAAASVPVLIGITIIVFVILSLIPGDPATAILGSYATPENVARLNAQLGLDRPLVQRYFIWLGNLLQGDLGRSFSLNRPVIDEILERFNATLILSGLAFVMCSVLGILAGVISATRQYGLADKLITFSVLVGISVPSFFLGMMMILYFAVNLRWVPASGMYALYGGGDLPDLLHHLVMPATALAVVATGVVARMSRSAMLEFFVSTSSGRRARRVFANAGSSQGMRCVMPSCLFFRCLAFRQDLFYPAQSTLKSYSSGLA